MLYFVGAATVPITSPAFTKSPCDTAVFLSSWPYVVRQPLPWKTVTVYPSSSLKATLSTVPEAAAFTAVPFGADIHILLFVLY